MAGTRFTLCTLLVWCALGLSLLYPAAGEANPPQRHLQNRCRNCANPQEAQQAGKSALLRQAEELATPSSSVLTDPPAPAGAAAEMPEEESTPADEEIPRNISPLEICVVLAVFLALVATTLLRRT